MEDVHDLEQKIQKLEADHKDYVRFGARCFIGILGIGMIMERAHDPF